jgi:hypothetical protein
MLYFALQELNIPHRAVFRSAQREFRARSRADREGEGKMKQDREKERERELSNEMTCNI